MSGRSIHLLPAVGLLGASRLEALYDVKPEDANLELLMRHRAVPFGLLGAFLLYGAFRPELLGVALAAGLVSVAAFLLLARTVDELNDGLRRVVAADGFALALLSAAAPVHGAGLAAA